MSRMPAWPARARDLARRARQHPRRSALVTALLALAVVLWALTRPGMPLGPVDLTWHRMQVNRDFYVGIDPSYPPFAEWTPERIEGIEPDIARELGRRMGVETSILIMGYDGLYDALYTGQVDLILAGLRADPLYADWVHYTQPYFDAGQVLVFRRDGSYSGIEALDGKTLAVEIASLGDQTAQQWQRRLRSLEIQRHMLPQDALDAVARGDADAALVDTITARLSLTSYPELRQAEQTTAPDEYVIAIRAADFRLIDAVERALDGMRADGTLDAILNRWLGSGT